MQHMNTAAAAPRGELDLGLARVAALLCGAGHPERRLAVVHVAGTNGKGSTAAFLARAMRCVYPAVATFTSPHLVRPRDAWRIDGVPASEHEYAAARARVLAGLPEGAQAPTEFELDVAACLAWLVSRGVTAAVIEVGVGGRDDATNVFRHRLPCACSGPAESGEGKLLASVITRIGIDHEALLGSTVNEIARHKAGILAPPPVVSVIGPQSYPDQVRVAVAAETPAAIWIDRAEWTNGSLVVYFADESSRTLAFPDGNPGAIVGYQVANAATALAVVDALQWPVSDTDLAAALASMSWPGRLHRVALPGIPTARVLVDGAHNPDGAHQLAAYLNNAARTRPLTWIIGMTRGKAVAPVVAALVRPGDRVACVEFSDVEHMPWVRPVAAAELADAVRAAMPGAHVVAEAKRVWDLNLADLPLSQEGELDVVVAGSLYLAADMYRWLE
ncbi:folylpolyglutamate synthase [Blastocladiella emersonii ATCC 22665]|nr:folylpolyglutamate synthase [Blastocladiella emersonii ATCC 22665]